MRALKAFIENSSDVISLVNPAGNVVYASAHSAKVFGYLPEEFVGRNAFELIHPEDRGHTRRAFRAVLASPPLQRQGEVRVRRKDGEWCWVESTISNHLGEPRIGAIIVNFREISARRAAREKEQRQSEELFRAYAQFEDFAYAVAHDFREPLRTIAMFTELLVREAELDAQGNALAQYIVDGATRMSTLLEGLQAFAIRGFEDPPKLLDLGHVVTDALQNLGHAIKTSDAIVTVGPMPVVQGNEEHLLRVFQNLIGNAIKYRKEAPVEIHVTAERVGPNWTIKVEDNGVGIAPEHQERIFNLLKRLHGPEIPGAGIGLAICKKIIETMGGEIWVESKPGSGSVFCFTIAPAKKAVAGSAISKNSYPNTPAQSVEAPSRRDIGQCTVKRGASVV